MLVQALQIISYKETKQFRAEISHADGRDHNLMLLSYVVFL